LVKSIPKFTEKIKKIETEREGLQKRMTWVKKNADKIRNPRPNYNYRPGSGGALSNENFGNTMYTLLSTPRAKNPEKEYAKYQKRFEKKSELLWQLEDELYTLKGKANRC